MAPKQRKLQRYFPGKPIAAKSEDYSDSSSGSESGLESDASDSTGKVLQSNNKIRQQQQLGRNEQRQIVSGETGINNTAYRVITTSTTANTKPRQILQANSTNNGNGNHDGVEEEEKEEEEEEEDDDDDDDNEDDEPSSDSDDESTSSDENNGKISRLVFVNKSKRKNQPKNKSTKNYDTNEQKVTEEQPASHITSISTIKDRALNYIEHQIRTEQEAQKLIKASNDEDLGDVTDTDDLDPEFEKQQWKIRELKRLKREKDAMLAKREEFEEREEQRLQRIGQKGNSRE